MPSRRLTWRSPIMCRPAGAACRLSKDRGCSLTHARYPRVSWGTTVTKLGVSGRGSHQFVAKHVAKDQQVAIERLLVDNKFVGL